MPDDDDDHHNPPLSVPGRGPIGVLGRQAGKARASLPDNVTVFSRLCSPLEGSLPGRQAAAAVRAAIAPEELPGLNPENPPAAAAAHSAAADDTSYD